MDQAENQNSQSQKISRVSENKTAREQHPSHGEPCPSCGLHNSGDSIYCEECGSELQSKKCPNCGSAMHIDGDLCENCGAWTLSGKCYICYSPILPGMSFCGECGNPSGGIVCASCGNVCHSDFCPNCQAAVTEQAVELLAKMKEIPVYDQYFKNCEQDRQLEKEIRELEAAAPSEFRGSAINKQDNEEKLILENLGKIARRRKNKNPEAVPAIVVDQAAVKETILNKPDSEIEARESKLKELKEKRKQLKISLQQPPAPVQEFKNAQDVRRYYMAIKPPHYKGWLCNAFKMLHADPIHCERPLDGGRWLSEEEYNSMEWHKGYEY